MGVQRLFAVALILTTCFGTVTAREAPAQKAQGSEGWLGVVPDSKRAAGQEATDRQGVVLSGIIRGSPAERAGLRARDVVLAVEGLPVSSPGEIAERVARFPAESWVALTIKRSGVERTVRARLSRRPPAKSGLQVRRGWIGVEAIDLSPGLRAHLGAPADAGAMISVIEPGSPAEAAGFELGDVVYIVDGSPVRSKVGLARLVAGGGVGNKLEITLVRGGTEIVLEAVVEEAPQEQPPTKSHDPGRPSG